MNEDDLGGYSTKKNNVLGTYNVGSCWCGQSYFVDPSDGIGRVVTSGQNTIEVFKVQTSPKPALIGVSRSPAIVGNVQFPGFFTSISSNGTASPIIWALSRPTNASGNPIYLYAFNPESLKGTTMTTLFHRAAGNLAQHRRQLQPGSRGQQRRSLRRQPRPAPHLWPEAGQQEVRIEGGWWR
jgi:hypothetical protein